MYLHTYWTVDVHTMSILMDMDTCYAHYFVARAAVAGDALVKGACLPALPASLPGALFILRGPNAPMGGSMWSSTSSLPRCWRGVFSIFVTETLSKALRRRFMFSPRQYLCIPARNLGLGRPARNHRQHVLSGLHRTAEFKPRQFDAIRVLTCEHVKVGPTPTSDAPL